MALRRSDKDKIDGYTAQLSDCENEIAMLRRRLQTLEDEMNKFKGDNDKVDGELRKARTVPFFNKKDFFKNTVCLHGHAKKSGCGRVAKKSS